jgi:molybdopterin converting factor small subunit
LIRVKFFGVLAEYMPEKDHYGFWVFAGDGLSVQKVLTLVADCSENKEFITHVLYSVFVNNELKGMDEILKDGDTLTIVPLLAGG